MVIARGKERATVTQFSVLLTFNTLGPPIYFTITRDNRVSRRRSIGTVAARGRPENRLLFVNHSFFGRINDHQDTFLC